MKKIIEQELQQAKDVLWDFCDTRANIESIERAAEIMIECIKSGGKIIACGNGGSMSDAMHFCSELTGRYRKNRPAIPAIAISDPGHLSCVANDFGYENVFERFVEAHGKEGDVLFALTTSGHSVNVLRACAAARTKNMMIVLITGDDTGVTNNTGKHVHIEVPHHGDAGVIQQVTIIVIHILVHLIEKGLQYA